MSTLIIHTQCLCLRPFHVDDAETVQELAGQREIADTTTNIPHPYEKPMAETWIGSHEQLRADEKGFIFAITTKSTANPEIEEESSQIGEYSGVIGAIGLNSQIQHRRAELGYWIGVPYWNHGYCTEAAVAVVKFGFIDLGLNRIEARHLTRNPASGRVLQKIGMRHEGTLRQHVYKWDIPEDVEMYGITKDVFNELPVD